MHAHHSVDIGHLEQINLYMQAFISRHLEMNIAVIDQRKGCHQKRFWRQLRLLCVAGADILDGVVGELIASGSFLLFLLIFDCFNN
jgi:hypothetical protein